MNMQNLQTTNQFQPIEPTAAQKSCGRCDYRAETADQICPRCRKKLFTKAEINLSGGTYIVGGLINVAVMLLVFDRVNSRIAADENLAVNPVATQALYGILLAFAACGIVWIAFGLLQIAGGKMYSRWMWRVMDAVLVIFVVSEILMFLIK